MAERNIIHLLDWSKIDKSKREGGLGIRPLKLVDESLLGKWLWWLGDGQNGLWKEVVMVKYNVLKDGWDTQKTKPSQSKLWRDLLSVRDSFDYMVRYRAGTGDYQILDGYWYAPSNLGISY